MIKKRRIELLDTSVLLELLRVPFESDRHEDVVPLFDERVAAGVELRLPAASLVEAGGHVARIKEGDARRSCAERLARVIEQTLDRAAPWSFEPLDWDADFLRALLVSASSGAPLMVEAFSQKLLEMGDLLILAEFRSLRSNLDSRVVDVDVWTLDGRLASAVDLERAGRALL